MRSSTVDGRNLAPLYDYAVKLRSTFTPHPLFNIDRCVGWGGARFRDVEHSVGQCLKHQY